MSEILVSISTLGQVDGAFILNKTEDVIYEITESCKIQVKENQNVKLMDKVNDGKVEIIGNKDSVISYTILNTTGTKRFFQIEGELDILEVSTKTTDESLLIELTSENATSNVRNLSILTNEKSNYIQRIDHKVKKTQSNIQNVGVAMDGASLVFDTTGKIEKGMSNSKCSQLSRGIVMDDISQITAKPILLIDEFDCFANHGASIGKMSDEDLFYLMSRGLTKKEAFLLILQGIIRPFIDSILVEAYRDEINNEIQKRIGE